MKMIKATDIRDALVEFCIMQDHGRIPAGQVNAAVNWALSVVPRLSCTRLNCDKVMSYAVYRGYDPIDDLLYDEAYDNSVICKNGVILGTFKIIDSSYIKTKTVTMSCGYDVIYNADEDEILLAYRVAVSAADGTFTVYRVKTETFEDFDCNGFIASLAVKMSLYLV
jgi:hypothetical protein